MKKFLMLVVVLVAVGAGYLYLNSGLMVKYLIEKVGSDATGVTVSVESVELDVLNGEATLYGLKIGNPEGFSAAHALAVDVISVGLDANTVSKAVMTVTKIYVENPVLTYQSVDGVSNFDVIKQNAESGASSSVAETEDAQKFIVKLIEFTPGKINAIGLSPTGEELNATMPGFKIENVGKAEGGISAAAVASRIAVVVTSRVIEAVVAGALFDIVGDTLGTVTGGMTDKLPGFGKKED